MDFSTAPAETPLQGYKLTIAYLGTPFAGWQQQPGKATVQEHLEVALARLWKSKISLQGAGRTDAGVHALAQVASFRAPRRYPAEELQRALNYNIPESIRIVQAEEVSPTFHARFDCRGKTYHYRIANRPLADPFRLNLCWHVPRLLDIAAMQQAAVCLQGRHDFSTFASNPGYERTTMVRTMHRVELTKEGDDLLLRLTADGFLFRMVRNIVGALVKVGHNRLSSTQFVEILEAKQRSAAPNTAPGWGLYMQRVYYEDELNAYLASALH